MAAPAVLLISLVAFYPILSAAWLSFHRIQLQFPELGRPFVGLANYGALLTEPRFWNSLSVTATFTGVTVALELVLGMGLALILNRGFRMRGLVRAAVLVPWAFTTVVSGLTWRFMYDPEFGIFNGILIRLQSLGLGSGPVVWLGDTSTALACAIVADVWKSTPFMALLLLAGLQTIPSELYEAATIDGAGRLQEFWRITLPLLRPTLLAALLFRTLDAFRVFDLIYVLTQGGPGNTTESLSYLTYIKLFREFDFGAGSALAVVMFVCVLLISFVFIKVLGARTR